MKIFDYLFDILDESRETLKESGIAKVTININELIDENVTKLFVYAKGNDYDLEVICEDIANETGIETEVKDLDDFDPNEEVLVYED